MTLCPGCESIKRCNALGYLGDQANYTEADLSHHIIKDDPAYQTWIYNLTSLYLRLKEMHPDCPNPEFLKKMDALAKLLSINNSQP